MSSENRFVDASVALILKRVDDAVRDGDRIHAVIREILSGEPEPVAQTAARSPESLYAGAATGLIELLSGVLFLSRGVLPAGGGTTQPWLSDRRNGPRQLAVTTTPTDGPAVRVLLEEGPVNKSLVESRPHAQGLGAAQGGRRQPPDHSGGGAQSNVRSVLGQGLFAFGATDRDALRQTLDECESLLETNQPIDRVARRWWREHRFKSESPVAAVVVARDVRELHRPERAAASTVGRVVVE